MYKNTRLWVIWSSTYETTCFFTNLLKHLISQSERFLGSTHVARVPDGEAALKQEVTGTLNLRGNQEVMVGPIVSFTLSY